MCNGFIPWCKNKRYRENNKSNNTANKTKAASEQQQRIGAAGKELNTAIAVLAKDAANKASALPVSSLYTRWQAHKPATVAATAGVKLTVQDSTPTACQYTRG